MRNVLQLSRLGLFFVSALSLFMISSCSSSRRTVGIEEGWEVIAEEKVNFVRDKDEIEVRSRNMFTAIRFTVEDRDVRISDLNITFQNGDKLSPAIDEAISANQSSRIIELALDGRYIDKIAFKYRTTGSLLKGRANVLIIGRRYNPGY